MTDGVVGLSPDSTGKKVDTSELTVGINTVERQRINISDPTVTNAHCIVANTTPVGTEYGLVVRTAGPTTIQGSQPTATVGSIIAATTVVGPVTVSYMNLVTVAFYGTFAGVSCVFEASTDGTNWFTIQGSRCDNGLVNTGLSVASSGFAVDIPVGAWSQFRVRATAWTSGTCSVIIAPQTFAYDPCPAAIAQGPVPVGSAVGTAVPVLIGGSDGTNTRMAALTAKGTQGTYAVNTMDFKDSGRTYVTFTLDRVTGIATEALATMAINRGAVASSATSYTVTTGKTLRIQAMSATILASSTTMVNGRVRLRANTTVAATSPILATLDIGMPVGTAAAGIGLSAMMDFPDGIELASATQVALTHIESAATSTVSVTVVGYEY